MEESAERFRQYQVNKVIAQNMQTPEGQAGMGLAHMMYETARTPVNAIEHGSEVYENIKDGSYGKALGYAALLALDIGPVKGGGRAASELISEAVIGDVTTRQGMNTLKGVAGVYIHEFGTNTVYVGQASNLAERPITSLKELMDKTNVYKGTARKAGDQYSGTTRFIPLEGSGYGSLNDLEHSILQSYGGTMKQGGNTYNIRRIPGQ
jgi:hypothetical protein